MLLMAFQNDAEVQDMIGWFLLAQIVLNIGFNMFVAFGKSLIQSIRQLRTTSRQYAKRMKKWDEVPCKCECEHCGTPLKQPEERKEGES